MQSNGIMKSSALASETSVSSAGALEQERRQPKVKHYFFPSAFPALHNAEAVVAYQGPQFFPFFFSLPSLPNIFCV